MHPIHDVDVVVLLALGFASKKRAAELAEIMAAADLIQGAIPPEAKLADAFLRLSVHGLIVEAEGRYALTPAAQEILSGQPRKAETAERIVALKDKLSAYTVKGEHAPIVLTVEQFAAAILAHRTSGKGAGQNMGMPKPKQAERNDRRPGHWRNKSGAPRPRKA